MKAFTLFLERHLHQPYGHWLIAVSGGIDSVVLLHLVRDFQIPHKVLHANFQLRGEESMRDEQFVRSLLGEVEVQRFDTLAFSEQNKMGIQEAARMLRYQWFYKEYESARSASHQQVFIATAHHANDSVESLMMNLSRGTGIEGLRGIPPINDKIIRPLIYATRAEIEEYARLHGLKWVEDSSNQEDEYTRNFIRNRVIPLLEKAYPSFMSNVLTTTSNLREAEMLYREAVALRLKKLVHPQGDEIHMPIRLLMKSEPLHTLVWEILKPYGFKPAQARLAASSLHDTDAATTAALAESPSHRLLKNRDWWIVAPLANTAVQSIFVVDALQQPISFPLGNLLVTKTPKPPAGFESDSHLACLDAAGLDLPLVLRPWKQGDYFYPLGMQKKKKLARFLIDLKLSKTEKERVWVLEKDKRILWVVGLRPDDRFKVTPSTREVLCIRLLPKI